jgi:hypothetical protein
MAGPPPPLRACEAWPTGDFSLSATNERKEAEPQPKRLAAKERKDPNSVEQKVREDRKESLKSGTFASFAIFCSIPTPKSLGKNAGLSAIALQRNAFLALQYVGINHAREDSARSAAFTPLQRQRAGTPTVS